MKETEVILKMLADGLKTLAVGIDKISTKVNEMATAQTTPTSKPSTSRGSGKKAAPSAPRRRGSGRTGQKTTAIETVYQTIRRSPKGVDAATLRKRTGFDAKKLQNIIYKLKQQGKIQTVSKGVYRKT
jgi:X-X-X-Leu-X-X-Gly heptad repeat protein